MPISPSVNGNGPSTKEEFRAALYQEAGHSPGHPASNETGQQNPNASQPFNYSQPAPRFQQQTPGQPTNQPQAGGPPQYSQPAQQPTQQSAAQQQPLPDYITEPGTHGPAPLQPTGTWTQEQLDAWRQSQQQPPSTAIRDTMAARGEIDPNQYQSDEQLLNELAAIREENRRLAALTQPQQRQPSTSSQPRIDANQSRQPTVPGQQEAASPPEGPTAPEWDERWSSLVRWDNSRGEYVPADDTVAPSVADRANQYARWQRDRASRMLRDPMDVLRESGLEDYVQERINSALENRDRQQTLTQSRQAIERDLQNYAGRFWKSREDGQQLRDTGGQPIPSEEGLAYGAWVHHLVEEHRQLYGGDPDPWQTHQRALQQLEVEAARRQFASQGGGRQQVSRGQPAPVQPTPPPPATSYQATTQDQTLQRALAQGHSHTGYEQPQQQSNQPPGAIKNPQAYLKEEFKKEALRLGYPRHF